MTREQIQPTPKPGSIRVGLIGASLARGWAAMAHIPALRATPDLTLHAVATRSEQSAHATAREFGVPRGFGDASAMIADEEIDAVVVAVKAPDHFPLVKQALLAGKPVYCEWPFGRSLDEARQLKALAGERGVTTAVGLQGRFSPWLAQVKEIVATGRLGRVLSTALTAYDELSFGAIDQGNAYLLDATNGANPLTIHAGHYLDALCFALGELDSVSAVTATSRPQVVVRQTGETTTATSPDQIAVCGLLSGGAVASFQLRAGGGQPSLLWEIQGEQRVLRVTCAGYLMWRPLTLELWDPETKRWEALPPPAADGPRMPSLPGPAQYVASVYAAFAEDILTGSQRSVSFAEAFARRATLEAIRTAASEGTRQSPATFRR